MERYTEKDLETFKRDEWGVLICPSGDYTQIEEFPKCCTFGDYCIFGFDCKFGEWCIFGERCSFGACCKFGEYCRFGEWCIFGKMCRFRPCCSLGENCSLGGQCSFSAHCRLSGRCSFGEWCSFGEYCRLGEGCSFGEECSFSEKCILWKNLYFEGLSDPAERVVKIDRIGSRDGCTYFFKTASGIYVRCGCFFGTIDEFEAKVNETHADNEQYRKEYLLAIEYIKAIMQ